MIKNKSIALVLACATLISIAPISQTTVNAAVLNGWSQLGNTWYYYKEGTLHYGWQYINGIWYHFNSNGAMETGWIKDTSNGKWYYLDENGCMRLSTVIDGYVLGSDGARVESVKGTKYTGTELIPTIVSWGYFKNDFTYDTPQQQYTLNPGGKSGDYHNDQIVITIDVTGTASKGAENIYLTKFNTDSVCEAEYKKMMKLIMPDYYQELYDFAYSSTANATKQIGNRMVEKRKLATERYATLYFGPIILG